MIVKYIHIYDDLWVWYRDCRNEVRFLMCNSGVDTASAYKALKDVRDFQFTFGNNVDIIYDSGEE